MNDNSAVNSMVGRISSSVYEHSACTKGFVCPDSRISSAVNNGLCELQFPCAIHKEK